MKIIKSQRVTFKLAQDSSEVLITFVFYLAPRAS